MERVFLKININYYNRNYFKFWGRKKIILIRSLRRVHFLIQCRDASDSAVKKNFCFLEK